MNSKIAFLLPIASIIYLLDTLLKKRFKVYFKMPLATLALSVVVFDAFVSLVFYVNCLDAGYRFGNVNCIGWIYPTLDFQIMAVISLIMLLLAMWGMLKKWGRKNYYFLGSTVLYLGVFARLFLLAGAAQAMAIADTSSNPIVFEIFSVVVVYGLVSASIYFCVFVLGIFRPRTLPQQQG